MRRPFTVGVLAAGYLATASAQIPSNSSGLLTRRYVEGTQHQYLMKGLNDGATYEVRLTSAVKKSASGRFGEEYAWSDFVANGKPRPLSASAQAFRMTVTLDQNGGPFDFPDLSKAPGLVGPITDLLTFCADYFLAIRAGTLRLPGDHVHVLNPVVASFADGRDVVLGQSAVDFDITLQDMDTRSGVAMLQIKHVPPAEPKIQLTAPWMRVPVAETPNNHVQVTKTATGFSAAVGKETFDVQMRIALDDGRILSATMDNPVTRVARDCSDAALTQCGETAPESRLSPYRDVDSAGLSRLDLAEGSDFLSIADPTS